MAQNNVSNVDFIPEGEDYGGVTDQHMFASSQDFYKATNIGEDFVCKAQHYNEILMQHKPINLELFLTFSFKEQNLEIS